MVAVAIDRRDRTRSRGYVEPEIGSVSSLTIAIEHCLKHAQTEVIPANAPDNNRVGVSSGFWP